MPRNAAERTAFKDELSPEVVAELAGEVARAWPGFPAEAFTGRATAGLTDLELKGRVAHVAEALAACLAGGADLDALVDGVLRSETFTGWMAWPFIDAVGACCADDPERGLELLRRLTNRWSAEFAIRPFVARHPGVAFAALTAWVDDPDEHVRRLVSEGTRPRLPWASRLRDLAADPSPVLPLLERLREDPSEYVRRSVANHLGDIAKDHPDRAVQVAAAWVADGGERSAWVARHGLRALVKAGHRGALALTGVDVDADVRVVALTADPMEVPVGGAVAVACTLVSEEAGPVTAEVDVRVGYPNARGEATRRKTFKFARLTLPPGVAVDARRAVAFREVSIRRIHPGPHLVEIQVNGVVTGAVTVEVTPAG